MEKAICLVFPHQLFEIHPAFGRVECFWLIEDELYFKQLPFHRKKLAFHRASMSYYAEKLRSKGEKIKYFTHNNALLRDIFESLGKLNTREIHIVDPSDFLLEKRLRRFAKFFQISIVWYENPSFYNTPSINEQLLGKAPKRYFMADFYKKQRQRLGILLLPNGEPEGGRWSFDTENRKALPKDLIMAKGPVFRSSWSVRAESEISQEFPENPGSVALSDYPVTHSEAKEALGHFLENKLSRFGPYQDAFSTESTFVFHSNLSTALNAGLLIPSQVVEAVLLTYQKGNITIQSVEGFIRQVIGWREFVRAVYQKVGVKQRTSNALAHSAKLDWNALGALPFLIETRNKIQEFAYAHHIERLMLLGNFFFLSEIHPDEVYRFFMANFMDAYDWVMVPNVYGMSQFADGGLMTTKPYFSSSNYLKNQGFKMDKLSAALFDALFWHFVDKHQDRLRKNIRTSQMVANWMRMAPEKKAAHLTRAATYFSKTD